MKKLLMGCIVICVTFSTVGCGKNTETAVAVDVAVALDEIEENTADRDIYEEESFSSQEDEQDYIELTDEYLIKLVKHEDIDPTDLDAVNLIKELEINIDKISNIEELSAFGGLEEITAIARTTYDIEWIKYCPQIKKLAIDYGSLKDISPVNDLNSLEWLRIEAYGIENLNDIKNLGNISALGLKSESITDISAVEQMKNLRYLSIDCPNLNDYSGDWSNLSELRIVTLKAAYGYDALATVDFNNPVFEERSEDIERCMHFIGCFYGGMGSGTEVNQYREEYDNDKISDKAHFKAIWIYNSNGLNAYDYWDNQYVTKFNYEFLSRSPYHIDSNYCAINDGKETRNALDEMIATFGNPSPDAIKIVGNQSGASPTWEDTVICCDGIRYGIDVPLKEMLSGNYEYEINGTIIDNSRINEILDNYAFTESSTVTIRIKKDGQQFIVISVRRPEKDVHYLLDGDIEDIFVFNTPEVTIQLPQERETNRIVTMDLFTKDSLPAGLPESFWIDMNIYSNYARIETEKAEIAFSKTTFDSDGCSAECMVISNLKYKCPLQENNEAVSTQADETRYVTTAANDGGVNMRSGPGTEYDKVVEMIPNGEKMAVSDETFSTTGKKWYKVKYRGTEGWVAASQVK